MSVKKFLHVSRIKHYGIRAIGKGYLRTFITYAIHGSLFKGSSIRRHEDNPPLYSFAKDKSEKTSLNHAYKSKEYKTEWK